jgi:hypothetical protein
MKNIIYWKPAVFCAFLSIIALVAQAISVESIWWRPAFFAFLPMCFYFVGSVSMQMHRELHELRRRIFDLEQKKVG